MTTDYLRYEKMIEMALRDVVRQALQQIAEQGLVGEHHIYLSFQTDFPGVEIPAFLKAKYPQEMTIVLQHQFQDLKVEEKAIGVTLTFGGIPARLTIPLEAVTGFADPSVNFALQFQSLEGMETEEETGEVKEKEPSADQDKSKLPQPGPGATVISLDAFRKK